MTKRPAGILCVAVAALVSACGGVAPPTANPLAFVHAAAARTAALHSFKMDMKMTMSGIISPVANRCDANGELPPAMAAALAASSQGKPVTPAMKTQMCAQLSRQATQPPQPYAMKMTAAGRFRAPSDYGSSVTMSIGAGSTARAPIDLTMQVIHVGTNTYVTDPQTGAWGSADKLAAGLDPSIFNNMNSASYTSFLDAARSVKDLGDTTLAGARVHHYQVVVDPDYLVRESIKKPMFKDPAVQKSIAQYAESFRSSAVNVEAWVGIDDQLLHREVTDVVQSPASATAAPSLITGLKQHVEVDFHDFNGRVDITAPRVP